VKISSGGKFFPVSAGLPDILYRQISWCRAGVKELVKLVKAVATAAYFPPPLILTRDCPVFHVFRRISTGFYGV